MCRLLGLAFENKGESKTSHGAHASLDGGLFKMPKHLKVENSIKGSGNSPWDFLADEDDIHQMRLCRSGKLAGLSRL